MKYIFPIVTFIIVLMCTSTIYTQSNPNLIFLNQNLMGTDKSMKRLSSGTLLWTDSPSSKAIYERLTSHINFLSVNINNNQDMISFYNSREGYLESIGASLQRIRELILRRSGSLYNQDDRELIDSEIYIHYSGILNELSWAQFNKISMFSSWTENKDLKERFKEDNFYTIEGIDRILLTVISERSRMGALMNTLEYEQKGLAIEEENSISFLSTGDTDFGTEISKLKRNEILFFSNLFLLRFQ